MRDTIDMAETISHGWWLDDEKLKAFADLVRTDEREACIKIAERKISKTWAAPKSPKEWWEMACKQIANDIRTRGNT